MSNLWDMTVADELTGAARDSAIYGELDVQDETDDRVTFKAILGRLDKHTTEYIIDPQDIEEMAGSWGHMYLLDEDASVNYDFTEMFDNITAADQTGFIWAKHLAWQDETIAHICQVMARAEDMTTANAILMMARTEADYAKNTAIQDAASAQWYAKFTAIRGLLDLRLEAIKTDMEKIIIHSVLNQYVAKAKDILTAMLTLYGWTDPAILNALEVTSKLQHAAIAQRIESLRQEDLKAFRATTLVNPATRGSEMAFTPARAQALLRKGWTVVPVVNTHSQVGL